MKISANNNSIILEEVYDGVTIKTKEGRELRVCLRDDGFEIRLVDLKEMGNWYHISNVNDLLSLTERRKKKLHKIG